MNEPLTKPSITECIDQAVEQVNAESEWRGESLTLRQMHNLKALLTKRIIEGLEQQDMAYMTALEEEVEDLRRKQEHIDAPRAELIEEHRRMRGLVKAMMYATGHSDDPLHVPMDFERRYNDVELSFDPADDEIRIATREDVESADLR